MDVTRAPIFNIDRFPKRWLHEYNRLAFKIGRPPVGIVYSLTVIGWAICESQYYIISKTDLGIVWMVKNIT